MDIGKKIEALREQKGLSQNKLAQLAKISQSSLSDIEAGKRSPRYDTLLLISKALGISGSIFEKEDNSSSTPIWVSDLGALGKKIQLTRTKRGMSEKELSYLSGIPYLEIYLVESGNNELIKEGKITWTYDTIRAIAKALEIKTVELTGNFYEENSEQGYVRFTIERSELDPVVMVIAGEAYKQLKEEELKDLIIKEISCVKEDATNA